MLTRSIRKQQLSMLFVYSFLILSVGCGKNALTSSLLSDYSSCTDDACKNAQNQTSVTGDLSISPDLPFMTSLVEDSDLLEISGSCSDLGRKKNIILMQLYEGETETNIPIIDNSINENCQDHISTTILQPDVSGTPRACVFVTSGIGAKNESNLTVQYPQCFNGRFSFQIRLGRILRQDLFLNSQDDTVNPKVNYLLRTKIRTLEGGPADSAWAKVIINRMVLKPAFSVKPNRESFRCEIAMKPAIFNDVRYTAEYSMTGPTFGQVTTSGGVVTFSNAVSGSLYIHKMVSYPVVTDGTSLDNFYHNNLFDLHGESAGGLLPGMTYKYRIKATDFTHGTDYQNQYGVGIFEDSGWTNEVTCEMPPPSIAKREENASANSCYFELAGANTSQSAVSSTARIYSLEWRYSESSNWVTANPDSGKLINTSGQTCRHEASCYIRGVGGDAADDPSIPRGKIIFLSARSYIDDNFNDQWDPGEYVGQWAPMTVTNGATINGCMIK